MLEWWLWLLFSLIEFTVLLFVSAQLVITASAAAAAAAAAANCFLVLVFLTAGAGKVVLVSELTDGLDRDIRLSSEQVELLLAPGVVPFVALFFAGFSALGFFVLPGVPGPFDLVVRTGGGVPACWSGGVADFDFINSLTLNGLGGGCCC